MPEVMLLILDGNSEIGAHVRSNHCYLIYLRKLIRSKTFTNRFVFSKKTHFYSCVCAAFSELPSNISNMINYTIKDIDKI